VVVRVSGNKFPWVAISDKILWKEKVEYQWLDKSGHEKDPPCTANNKFQPN
jgi:hypothetical protein